MPWFSKKDVASTHKSTSKSTKDDSGKSQPTNFCVVDEM